MRLIFYVLLLSQFFNLLDVLAENFKKEPSEQRIKWQKVRDDKSNNLKKIIWKSYNDDETYFENININNKENKSNNF